MSTLAALLSQHQTPNLPTRKGLILTGLQHDFLSPDGKLPVSNLNSGFLDRTKSLIQQFRGHGDIIWIRTETEASKSPTDLDEDSCSIITSLTQHDRAGSGESSDDHASASDSSPPSRKRKPGNGRSSRSGGSDTSKRKQHKASHDEASSAAASTQIDDEQFLTRTANRDACFIRGTVGADFAAEVKASVQPTDLQVIKSYYSAFSSTSLLLTLRTKLITELYVCGAMTNLNVYATSMDAARYGIKITIVEDCLGYRVKERHDLAIKRLVDIMDASVATSDEVVAEIGGSRRPAGLSSKHPSASFRIPETDDDVAAGMLEAASSEEEEDDDLLSVGASPYKSLNHKPLEIRGGRPKGKHLQAGDTGSEGGPASQHPQPQRHALATPVARHDRSRQQSQDAVQRTEEGQGKAVKPSRGQASSQPRIVPESQPDELTSRPSHQPGPSNNRTKRPRQPPIPPIISRPSSQPLFGPGTEIESQTSSINYDLLSPDRLDNLFHTLKAEVNWQHMYHQTGEVPRLVCCQGTIDPVDGSKPVYRHPADSTLPLLPWSPAVDEIRRAAEHLAGHELNHALIQLYRAPATDFITEHSDKTLDIHPDSFIVNASFGAERVMRLRSKRSTPQSETKDRTTHRLRLPHNSALLMSLPTNARFLHGIQPDKRAEAERSAAEKAYEGQRISLTFRRIATFLDAGEGWIWGQGARGKGREDRGRVLGAGGEAEALLKGFGMENASGVREWAVWYGDGSDVLHLK